MRPRVWFGERWINSVFDLFEENVRYFPALLPITTDEDPVAVLEEGGTPTLGELRLHNGTIYRWNRPVYDINDGTPHLRVENRVLPAGPTVADLIANAAFYFGLVRHLAESDRPLWSQMSFQAAEENFETAAEDGIDATIYWPGLGEVKATELVLRRLLPMAHAGLESWGVGADERDRLLGMIEQRCLLGVNGASWFVDRMHRRTGAVFDPAKTSYESNAPHLLGGPRPDPGHAPGKRRRHAVPLGDLLDERDAQRDAALASRDVPGGALACGHGRITTEIAEAGPFYYAEDYHQQYLARNPFGYCGLGGTGVSCPIGAGVAA